MSRTQAKRSTMADDFSDYTLSEEQTARLAEGPRLYTKPHEDRRPAAFDWGSTRPTCKSCSQRSMDVDSTGLCPACRTPAPTESRPATQPSETRPAPRPAAPRTRPADPREKPAPKPKKPARSKGAGAQAIKARLDELGVTAGDVRAWAREQGIDAPTTGLVSVALIEQYAAAPATSTTAAVEPAAWTGTSGSHCPKCSAPVEQAVESAPTMDGQPVLLCRSCRSAIPASRWTVTLEPEQLAEQPAPVIEELTPTPLTVDTCGAAWRWDAHFTVHCSLPAGHELARHVTTVRGNGDTVAVVGW